MFPVEFPTNKNEACEAVFELNFYPINQKLFGTRTFSSCASRVEIQQTELFTG